MEIKEVMREIHSINQQKGFWDGETWNFGEKIALIHSELSEALEAHRDGNIFKGIDKAEIENSFYSNMGYGKSYSQVFEELVKNKVQDELADSVIRIFDLAEKMNIDLEWHIKYKIEYNKLRPFKHGKTY